MISGIQLKLEEYRPRASMAERNILDVILTDPQSCAGLSIHDFAAKAFTSPSTVVRFCRKLGCEGYREFQQALVYDLAMQKRTHKVTLTGISSDDSIEDIVKKVTRKNMDSLEASLMLAHHEGIETCVKLLEKARVINLFGMGSSLIVARDLQLKLMRVDVACNLADDWHSQLICAMNMQPGDVAIAISYSGLTREVIECARSARRRGAHVVAITRSGCDSPLVKNSDTILEVAETELMFRSGAMSSRICQLNMIDILFAALVSRNYDRMARKMSNSFIMKDGVAADEWTRYAESFSVARAEGEAPFEQGSHEREM